MSSAFMMPWSALVSSHSTRKQRLCQSNGRCCFRQILELSCCSRKGGGGGHGPCSDFCGDWSADLPLILSVSRMLSTSPLVDWGVHRGRGSSVPDDTSFCQNLVHRT